MRTLGDGGSFVADSNFALRTAQKCFHYRDVVFTNAMATKRMTT